MGRYNFTALRVRRRAIQSLQAGQIANRPVWLDITGEIPPAQVFVRKQPQAHPLIRQRVKTIPSPPDAPRLPDGSIPPPQTRVEITTQPKPRGSIHSRTKKSSKLFKPMEMRYEEDELRQRFFKDHPWELARPRMLLENDGLDGEKCDWSTGIEQHQNGKKLDGESVIQRQLYLLHTTPDITVNEAYDQARREFYAARQFEDVERRVAAEEARYVGAQFAPDVVSWGMALEDAAYDEWEDWSRQQVLEREQKRAAFAGGTVTAPEELVEEELEEGPREELTTEAVVEEGTEKNGRLPEVSV